MERHVLEISWASLWRVLFFLTLAAIMYLSLEILMGLFLAIVISCGLDFVVDFLERRGIPRTLGVIMIFLCAALLVIITIYMVLPLLIIDMNTALIGFDKLSKNSWWGPFIDLKHSQTLNQLINQVSGQFFSSDSSPLGAFSNIFGSLTLTISILISSFYLSLTQDGVERFIRAVFGGEYERPALRIYARSRRRIGHWFQSQILLSIIVGVLVLIALLLLGVRHAMLMSLVAAVFELVPFIGPLLAGAAAVVSAFITSPTLALYTFIIFLAIHQIESHLLIPLLMGRGVGLHPVIVIIALLIGLEVGGFLGILISVPAAVVIQEVLEGWHVRDEEEYELA